jgi:hypothetical protein
VVGVELKAVADLVRVALGRPIPEEEGGGFVSRDPGGAAVPVGIYHAAADVFHVKEHAGEQGKGGGGGGGGVCGVCAEVLQRNKQAHHGARCCG